MGVTVPERIIAKRREMCRQRKCEALHAFDDNCARCLTGQWGPYQKSECGSATPPLPATDTVRTPRPGDVMSKVIAMITGERATGLCNCAERIAQMNEWGWLGCMSNHETIVGWLCEEAAKRGHIIDNAGALALFRAALRELRIAE